MGLQGDLSTLDLTNLLQNLEGARKSGLLTVQDEGEQTRLFFADGRLALIAFANRPAFVDFLLAADAVTPRAVEQARKRRKRGQTLVAALIDGGALSAQEASAAGAARLTDEACEVLAAGADRFEFAEIDAPPEGFDQDEQALGIALSASPLLLESARRSDHWALIREQLPSDSAHYTVARAPVAPEDPERARFVGEVIGLLDGSRSVREVVACFPAGRFEVYQLLADLARSRAIRPVPVADLNRRVLELARRDKKRAWALLERSLEQNPHHLALLCTKAMLAEKAGDLEQACEALKLVVHLQLEGAEQEEARATLERLKDLDENDPFAWEKSFELAIEEGRTWDAAADGRTLIGIYRKPGLHKKVVSVLERLNGLGEPTWDLVRELARARAESGERDAAVKGLEKYAASLIGLESYPLACKAYEEILAIQPRKLKAQRTLEELRSGALAQRRARWRRLRRRVLAGFLVLVVLPWLATEALARRAYVGATRAIVHEHLLEKGRYAEAERRYRAVQQRYPWTTTALFEIDPLLAELGSRMRAATRRPRRTR
jgi:tetratricopeptide (TPR) repeat protein